MIDLGKRKAKSKANSTKLPTSIDLSSVSTALTYAGKLDRLQENSVVDSDNQTIIVKPALNRISFLSKSGKITVFLPDNTIGAFSDKSNIETVFTFILCKVADTLPTIEDLRDIDYRISFHLSELVDVGIFADLRGARAGFNAAINYLIGIRLSSSRKIVKSDYGDENTNIFTYGKIINGIVTVQLNNNLDWNVLASPYVSMPKEAFSLSPAAFKLVKSIYATIRRWRISEEFKLPLGYVFLKTGLTIDGANRSRTINRMSNIIDEINDHPNLNISLMPIIADCKNLFETIRYSSLLIYVRGNIKDDMKRIENNRSKLTDES